MLLSFKSEVFLIHNQWQLREKLKNLGHYVSFG